MKSPVLAMLVVSLTAAAMACSGGESGNASGGSQTGGSLSNGGNAASGSQSASGGASGGSKSSSEGSSLAGSSDSGGKSSAGGSSATSSAGAGQSTGGGKTGTGGSKSSGGDSGSAGVTTGGQSSAVGGTSTGGSSGTGGKSATGGQSSTGGRSTGTGGDSAGGASVSSGGAAGGSVTGGAGGSGTAGSTGSGAAVASKGCGKTPTLANGARKIGNRNFMLRIPANYDNQHPYPLVFAFHWQGGTMNDVDGGGTSGYTWSYYGIREKADNSTDHKMIFVAPDGNGGWPNSGGADLKFVDDIYAQVTEDLCVDTTRVFSMGFSYGGGMTYEIACARAKTFRAAAVYAGAQLSGCDGGKDPIAYIGFHSVSDPKCGYGGGEGLRDTFVNNNGCTKQTPPKPNGMTHVCTKYTGCKAGYPVEWCAFDGAGHSPAPVDGQSSDSGGGDKTWTKAEVWAFFTQF